MMRRAGASIYPMVQNIILACRALGLGTLITTNHMLYEDEVKAVLELPDDLQTYALMPIGYPRGNFGPLTRRALSEVVHADRWSNSCPGEETAYRFREFQCIPPVRFGVAATQTPEQARP